MQPTSATSGTGAWPADSDVVERLPSLATADEHDTKSIVAELQGLVGALVDQLAAGQVETLYSLQSAAATVRRNSAELQATAVVPIEQLHEVLTALAVAQTSLEATAASIVSEVVGQVTSRIGEQVAALVDQRLSAAVGTITQVSEALVATAARFEEGVERTTREAVENVGEVADKMLAVSAETLDGLDHTGRILTDTMAGRIEAFFTELGDAFDVQTQRDVKLEGDLDSRVRNLVDRTEAAVSLLSERLSKETDRLALRDEEQEQLRVAAFVRALEGLLSRGGGRGQLRDRVRDVLVNERRKRAVVVAEQEVVPAVVLAPPEMPAEPKKAAPKTPAKKTPAKKTPAKKTLAPRKRTTPEQEDTL